MIELEEPSKENNYESFYSETADEKGVLEDKIQQYSIEDLIIHSKGNLKYQKIIFWGFCLAQIMLGMVTVSLIFFFYSVSFLCFDEDKSNKQYFVN